MQKDPRTKQMDFIGKPKKPFFKPVKSTKQKMKEARAKNKHNHRSNRFLPTQGFIQEKSKIDIPSTFLSSELFDTAFKV